MSVSQTRVFQFFTLALILAAGMLRPQLLRAQGDAPATGPFKTVSIPVKPAGAGAPVSTALVQGILGIGPLSPLPGAWPCFGGTLFCPVLLPGSLVVGTPLGLIPSSCSGCAQIYWSIQTASASGNTFVELFVTQGKNTLLALQGPLGPIPPNTNEVIFADGISLASTAVPGPAQIVAVTKVGSAIVTGVANILLQ